MGVEVAFGVHAFQVEESLVDSSARGGYKNTLRWELLVVFCKRAGAAVLVSAIASADAMIRRWASGDYVGYGFEETKAGL
jgi:hypothetical protein